MKLKDRLTSETPNFFKKVRTIGIILAAAGAAIIGLPATLPAIVLPAVLVNVAGYLVAAGTVATAVSQTVVKGDEQ
jgi:hypothetical protein